MADRPIESWRARAAVSEAIDVFNSTYMQEIWTKALARREADPEGAVTSARTLLESLCKHILEDAKKTYREGASLPELYNAAASTLEIAPTDRTAPIFTTLFTACAEVIRSIGNLRNHLSDAHGRGPFGTMPDWRHAELAVNLSGAMATYLAAVWKGRQPTVADVIQRLVSDSTRPIGMTHRYILERLARDPIGDKIASNLQVSDLVAYAEHRRSKGVMPQTVHNDLTLLRGALGDTVGDTFDDALVALRTMKLVSKAGVRKRRPTHEEYDALIAFYREADKDPKTDIEMADLVEFAVWSGRTISRICQLRWADVDFKNRTCKLPGKKEAFPLLEKAWEVVLARKEKRSGSEERIFPYNSRSVSARHYEVKKRLSETIPSLRDFRFNDLRYEAINRLLEKGHPPHIVAEASGMHVTKVVHIFKESKQGLDLSDVSVHPESISETPSVA